MESSKPGKLFLHKCYLAGPIDRAEDAGSEWRNQITPFLAKMGVLVMDPLNKPCDHGLEKDDDRARRQILQREGDFDNLARTMKPVRHVDMRMVDKADFLIVNFDMDIMMCGTMREIFLAVDQCKPILIHCPQGKAKIAQWMFAECPHQLFFDDWNMLRSYLTALNASDPSAYLDKKWVFFDFLDQTIAALNAFSLTV